MYRGSKSLLLGLVLCVSLLTVGKADSEPSAGTLTAREAVIRSLANEAALSEGVTAELRVELPKQAESVSENPSAYIPPTAIYGDLRITFAWQASGAFRLTAKRDDAVVQDIRGNDQGITTADGKHWDVAGREALGGLWPEGTPKDLQRELWLYYCVVAFHLFPWTHSPIPTGSNVLFKLYDGADFAALPPDLTAVEGTLQVRLNGQASYLITRVAELDPEHGCAPRHVADVMRGHLQPPYIRYGAVQEVAPGIWVPESSTWVDFEDDESTILRFDTQANGSKTSYMQSSKLVSLELESKSADVEALEGKVRACWPVRKTGMIERLDRHILSLIEGPLPPGMPLRGNLTSLHLILGSIGLLMLVLLLWVGSLANRAIKGLRSRQPSERG